MPFTEPPDFENPSGWSSYVGEYVVLEPIERLSQITTKFGVQNAWDCVVWKLNMDHLEPTPGVRIFNPKLVSSLDLAARQNAPMAGFVSHGGKNGNATVLINDHSVTMELLDRLWNNGDPVVTSPAEEANAV
jgi:hypothetical protein